MSKGRVLMRRLRRALLCALSLYLSFIIVSPAGENGKDAAQHVNLFLDITSNRLADEIDISKKKHISLAGMPVVVGGKRQDGTAPSVAAGIAGSYKFDLGNHVSMKPSGVLSRTHTDGAGFLSSGRAGGDVAIQYQDGGTGLLLRPSLYASMQDDVLDHMDYALESKLWQAIGWGINMTATLGHSWRVSDVLDTDDRERGYGRLGLKFDLFDESKLELAYGFTSTDGPLASQDRFTQGPSLTAHLAMARGWRIDGSYSFTNTERGYDDNNPNARRHDMAHRLGLKSDWDIFSTTGAEWHVTAGYDFEQTVTDDPVCTPANHIASMNFALNF
ncbi:MAG: hypothetical protein R3D05_22570 [Dongiaceae bacterium]